MNPISSESSSAPRRSMSDSSLPAPLQDLVDKAEKERDLYEDPWSRIPGPQASKQVNQPEKPSKEQGSKRSILKKPRLPASLQRLIDKAEVDREVYEDSWSRIPRALGWGKYSKKQDTKKPVTKA
ncbi:uncharacterized protein PV07_03996 [Cladophialophora immunda]|uniref:Uncharacterized protein n=1 Tax=Cladophialophora immunda TaxID=569365 RepID=A0A0D2CR55_9EURO|nr:uncharacterized protein PV07_03996 [Cladophialophora immunda]KIW32450.1 hypothetical protein PV07_03996 [Cladophialophora immunda]OQV04056.1 hypothetical protein CLAIMM_09005 [Cladophialophora immunda]